MRSLTLYLALIASVASVSATYTNGDDFFNDLPTCIQKCNSVIIDSAKALCDNASNSLECICTGIDGPNAINETVSDAASACSLKCSEDDQNALMKVGLEMASSCAPYLDGGAYTTTTYPPSFLRESLTYSIYRQLHLYHVFRLHVWQRNGHQHRRRILHRRQHEHHDCHRLRLWLSDTVAVNHGVGQLAGPDGRGRTIGIGWGVVDSGVAGGIDDLGYLGVREREGMVFGLGVNGFSVLVLLFYLLASFFIPSYMALCYSYM